MRPAFTLRLETPELILKDFIELRYDYYKKRKEHIIKVLETKAKMCEYKFLHGRMVHVFLN